MKIGFDAKRFYFNRSGLGNYSRNLIRALSTYYTSDEYYLYTPAADRNMAWPFEAKNIRVCPPRRLWDKTFPSLWRAFGLTKQIAGDAVDIFHGVNNELPYNIHRTKTKSVMTVHDLIVFRFPAYYQPIDRLVYTMKSKYGLMRADKIVAISKQTKEDIVNFQHVDASRIDVVYQGCDPIYYQQYDAAEIAVVKKKYGLPEEYMVSVGTIEERKNVLSVVEALHKGRIDFPFVIVGRPTAYSSKVKKYISENKVKNRIILCHSVDMRDLPALYQGAKLFIYPSFFEGFGIPVLEALYSRVPVITTRGGCFSEAGGPSSLYIDPMNTEEIGENINKVLNDSALRLKMISDGYEFAQRFREETIAENMMHVYLSIM